MSEPFGVFPLAIAAGGGRIDGFGASELIAAGLTMLQRAPKLVRALHRTRSGILLQTSPRFLTALAGSEGHGAVLINPLAASAEVAFQIRDAGIGAVFTESALAGRVPAEVPRVLLDDAPRTARLLIDGTSTDIDLGSHFGLDIEGDLEAEGRDEEAAVVYTSAMAGTPLGAILTHRNLISNARATVTAARLRGRDHALALLPFAHLFGLIVSAAAPLMGGGRVTTMPRFEPSRAIGLIETDGVTLLVGVPSVFAALLHVLERRGRRLEAPALRVCICGGAPLAEELQERWFDRTGVELRQGYGLTEAGPVCLFNRVDLPNRRGTLGVPFPGVEVSVHDVDTGELLPAGVEGEICVAGDNVSPGYVQGATAGERASGAWTHGLARRGRWLRTADLGVLNADGTVTFRGVLKPMFTRNGFNIFPAELERAVAELPGVRHVAVRAVPDPRHENDIALDVTGSVSEGDVRDWCARRLSRYKQPTTVTVHAG